ncbi:hypothetical protein [Alkalihalobacillus sp. LMS39]|uniref:hypothetical protein n=1 Tax=Alkalihalobacillus sp. LMS39 TaxID=2924032 RepID=UPI001FB28004|nr:hypothetical protein [Alkalihalobacillus sp. LMS39]UOE94722.1 hypothetical protein MM271_03490 [Alkalihalobacillus sp. LMS39]
MRKKIMILMVFMVLITPPVQALSWAYAFVVWNGNVYQVTGEEVGESFIGQQIGKVTTKPNDMTGRYYGNASNSYPKGTKYYEIEGIETNEAIAVEEKAGVWFKAVYENRAPFHLMNVVYSPYFYVFLLGMAVVILLSIFKKRRVVINKS